ncbi:MAG: GIY-YIG nuclease family protein [Acetobacteraceae bacterium]|nr:GIY-YIG nuclease family protein [Acetobacteraceae bacterium]
MAAWSPRYPLDEQGVRCAPTDPGVYRLYVRTAYHELKVFYVGQSEDLRRRLREHIGPDEANACIRRKLDLPCEYDFTVVRGESERREREAELVRAIHPECNQG